jgi:hypothetical protein
VPLVLCKVCIQDVGGSGILQCLFVESSTGGAHHRRFLVQQGARHSGLSLLGQHQAVGMAGDCASGCVFRHWAGDSGSVVSGSSLP